MRTFDCSVIYDYSITDVCSVARSTRVTEGVEVIAIEAPFEISK